MTHRPAHPLPQHQTAAISDVGSVQVGMMNVNMDVKNVMKFNEPSCMWNNYLKEQVRP